MCGLFPSQALSAGFLARKIESHSQGVAFELLETSFLTMGRTAMPP
jgi:hypothetical protein